MAQSHRSTGLTDLLMSRTASEGGYDSDAMSITTPVVRSAAGTWRTCPPLAKDLLQSTISSTESVADTTPQPNKLAQREETSTSANRRERAKSSPLPDAAPKPSSTESLQLRHDESPSNALRRLSTGLANGTIRLPSTPELRAMRMPSMKELEASWRLSVAGSIHDMVTNEQERAVNETMKILSDRIVEAKRESLLSPGSGSRAAALDPVLLKHMALYAEKHSSDETPLAASHATVTESCPKAADQATAGVIEDQTRIRQDSQRDLHSLAESDKASIHLMNMRISQRLASTSVMPGSTPIHSNNTSSRSLASLSNDGTFMGSDNLFISRFPSFITTEHVRRPSDPQTRRLFENVSNVNKSRPIGIAAPSRKHTEPQIVQTKATRMPPDDASSIYWDGGEIVDKDIPSMSVRQSSFKNPNSIAVGGRLVPSSLPARHLSGSIGQLSTAEENAWFKGGSSDESRCSKDSWGWTDPADLDGRRSVSLPEPSNYLKPESTSKAQGGKHIRRTQSNERFSAMSVDGIYEQQNEQLSEAGPGNLRTDQEGLTTKVDHMMLESSMSLNKQERRISAGWLTQGQRSGWGFDLVNSPAEDKAKRAPSTVSIGPNDAPLAHIEESATNMWERAIRRAQVEPDERIGGFWATPQFDREGRRRSRMSVSERGATTHGKAADTELHDARRSRSAQWSRRSSFDVDIDRHQRMCSIAREPLLSLRSQSVKNREDPSRRKSQTMNEKRKPRGKSLLDLNKIFKTIHGPPEVYSLPSSTGVKDLESWARFPSHTREQRNGPAGDKDRVLIRDFLRQDDKQNNHKPRLTARATRSTLGLLPSTSSPWRLPIRKHDNLDRTKSKSMNVVMTSAERARQRREGLAGQWRNIYRRSCSGLKAYTSTYGHRSSVSIGATVEYPELEVLPGEGMLAKSRRMDLDGSDERLSQQAEGSDIDNLGDERSRTTRDAMPLFGMDANVWREIYKDCMSSTSALKSDSDMTSFGAGSPSGIERHVRKSTGYVCSSAEEHPLYLKDQQGRAKDSVLEKVAASNAGVASADCEDSQQENQEQGQRLAVE